MDDYLNDKEAGIQRELTDFNQPQEEEREEAEEEEVEEGPFMVISNDSLSYERFYPGRILGNTFQVTNKSRKKMLVSLDFTTEKLNKEFVCERLTDFYEVTKVEEIEQPYQTQLHKPFPDSQKDYECWFVEDPKSKSLVKSTTLEIEGGESYEFIIVLKSPVIKKSCLLLTNLKVRNETFDEEHLILGFGSLDIPKLICPKEIMNEDKKYSSVKVVMRKNIPIQMFRFLLVNKGDTTVNINFSSFDDDSHLKFFIKSPSMQIEGGQRTILEVKASHKYKNYPDNKWSPMNSHKLIIGKIKD